MIYLAAPYTFTASTPEANKRVMERRYYAVMELAVEMKENGLHPISSVLHWHEAAKMFSLRKDHHGWKEYNRELLVRCNKMIVYCLPGWEDSSGVEHEIRTARSESVPIGYRQPSDKVINDHHKLLTDAKSEA